MRKGLTNEQARILVHLLPAFRCKKTIGVNYNTFIRRGRTKDARGRYEAAAKSLKKDGLISVASPWAGSDSRVISLTGRGEKVAKDIKRYES